MTREEAIKSIQDFTRWFKKNKPIYEALEMAIQALEQEPKSPCDLCRFDCKDICCLNCHAMAKGDE